MFDYIPEYFKSETADTIEEAEGWYTDKKNHRRPARAAAPRRGGPGDQLRDQGRPRVAARRRLPRHRLAPRRRVHPPAAAVDVPPVQGARRRRHHRRADGGRPDLPLRDGRRRGRRRHRAERRSRACTPPARSPAACTGPTGSAATRCRTCWSSAAAPATTPRTTPTALGRTGRAVDRGAGPGGRPRRRCAPFEEAGGENPYTIQKDLQDVMQRLVGIIRKADELAGLAGRDRESSRSAPRSSRSRATGSTTPAGTWRWTCDNMLLVSECIAKAALERQESRGGHTRDDFPDPRRSGARSTWCSRSTRGREPSARGDAAPAAAGHARRPHPAVRGEADE